MASYLGNSPDTILKQRRANYRYVATSGQSYFNGVDSNGLTAAINTSDVEVYLNGVLLDQTDYNISATQLHLLSSATVGDIVEIITYNVFSSADQYTKNEVDTKVSTAITDLVGTAGTALNTLGELSDALNDDANFASTVTTALAAKANTSSLATVATSGSYNDLSNKPTITPTAVSDQSNSSTGYFDLPTGTTAQRPGSPNAGMIRLNSEQSAPEIYIGSAWTNIALSGLVRSNLILNLDPTLYSAGSSTWADSTYSGLTFSVGNSANTTKPTAYIIDDTSGSTYAYYTSNIASTTFGTSDFTIECWIYINTTNYGGWRYIFGKSNFWGTGEYGLYFNETGTALGFHTTAANGVQIALSSIGTGWKHITATRSSSGRKLYVNSALVVSDSVVDNCTSTAGTYYGSSSSGGAYTDSTYKLGSARMYSKALSETEVSTNFAYERSRYGV